MKKLILCLLSAILLLKWADAQIVYSAYSQSYPNDSLGKPGNIGIMTCELEINNSFWDLASNSVLRNYLEKDTAFVHNRPKEFVAINSFDTAKVHFFLHGVNAGQWEYRVMLLHGKIFTPWSPVTMFSDKLVDAMSTYGQMAYLGGYYPGIGNWIVVDARKKGSTQIAATSVVAWEPIKPAVAAIYTPDELNLFLSRLARPWSQKITPE